LYHYRMKISLDYPRFSKNTLLVVTGEQEARFFHALGRGLNEIDDFKIAKPKFTDREGLFANSSGHGTLLQRGAGYDNQDEKVKQDFKKSLKQVLAYIARDYEVEQVYIFAPPQAQPPVLASFPPNLSGKISLIFDGDFTQHHPNILLDKIDKSNKVQEGFEKNPAIKEEALKILQRSEK